MLLLAAFALFAGSAVQAATINVTVGDNGTLAFNPTNVVAATGDTILFTFKSGSHTVTQSTFANPCTANGTDSGPMPAAGVTPEPTYSLTINGTDPLWYYCKTGNHCKSGMVFAVNPTAEKTYDAYKANAVGGSNNGTSNATTTAPATSSSTSSNTTTSSKGAANGRASVGIGAVAAAILFGGINAI